MNHKAIKRVVQTNNESTISSLPNKIMEENGKMTKTNTFSTL